MLKEHIKTHFSGLYSLGRSVRDASKNNKKLKENAKLYNATHIEKVGADAPLATIIVNDGPKRLNLVFSDFSQATLEKKEMAEFLAAGISFAKDNDYVLRIISRNNLADQRAYSNFLMIQNIEGPVNYSFYTDSAKRVSGKTYRLDITKDDVFFIEGEQKNLKDWIKNGRH